MLGIRSCFTSLRTRHRALLSLCQHKQTQAWAHLFIYSLVCLPAQVMERYPNSPKLLQAYALYLEVGAEQLSCCHFLCWNVEEACGLLGGTTASTLQPAPRKA